MSLARRLSCPHLRSVVALLSGAALLFACFAEDAPAKKKKRSPVDPGDDWYEDEIPAEELPIEPSYVNEDSGAFGASSRPASAKDGGGGRDGGLVVTDAAVLPKTYCTGPLARGDLAIVEILIASRAGVGDDGEWLELQNTKPCWLRVRGVTIESPRGQSAPNVATVDADLELAPAGTFVVAASADPAKNNGLSGPVIAWNATDVLKNDGDTVTVKSGATVIDSVTYPAFSNLETGRSLSFPSDCAWGFRGDWRRWSLSFREHDPGQRGTPNASNDDVACF